MRRCLLRLRRRPSFWLGLFVACFMAWAWCDSYRHELMASHVGNARHVQFGRMDGASYVASGEAFLGELPGFGMRYPAGIGMERWKGVWELFGVRHHRIPDSLVFFSFLGLWVGWLAFSEWKVRKKPRV